MCLLATCSAPGPPADYGLGNPVFANASLVETGVPAFDSTVSSTPTFTWHVTGATLVFLAVFTKSIEVKENEIQNVADIVWAWHSGLHGRRGDVAFTEGENVVNGELQSGSAPTPLVSGQSYYWAVWAWDANGINIAYSSQEMYFTVQ